MVLEKFADLLGVAFLDVFPIRYPEKMQPPTTLFCIASIPDEDDLDRLPREVFTRVEDVSSLT